MKGKVFNIQKFSVHDGPGIRTTVFLKGCPLRCMWCHNPESFSHRVEMMWDSKKCTHCLNCVSVCPAQAVHKKGEHIVTDMTKCIACDLCVLKCPNDARELVGSEVSVDELVTEVLKDKVFYENSGGGVTFSGGEPLAQADFVLQVAKNLKSENIHVAIDTSGYWKIHNLNEIIEYTDLFLYDLKMIDQKKHKYYTGVSNELIIENLHKLIEQKAKIDLRLPIIGGVNDEMKEIERMIEFVKHLDVQKVRLLPYHNMSEHKYRKLGKEYPRDLFHVPKEKELLRIKERFEESGVKNIKIGG